jgi:hypothetical protein
MEEIKGMSDAEARRWLQKHGYGVGDIDMIIAGEDPNAPQELVAEPAPVVVEAAPAPKSEPKAKAEAPKPVEVKSAPAPKPVAAPAPKAKK